MKSQFANLAERRAFKQRERERLQKQIDLVNESDSSVSMLSSVMLFAIIVCTLIAIILFSIFCSPASAEEINVEKYVNAIYKAEGGDKAQYPYGIRSIKCDTKSECRQICVNTVKNNIKRFNNYGHKTHKDFLSFLASRYAPVNAKNDPRKLNNNWIKNVSYFLGGA